MANLNESFAYSVFMFFSLVCGALSQKGCNVEISKTLDAPQCAKGTSTSAEGLSSFRVDSSENPSLQDGRYIDIDSLYSYVKEIQVLGECPDNYCGTSCTEFCFCKTPLTTEEKEAGINCHDGCKEGWSGQRCGERRCLSGEKMIGFGLGCRYQCKCNSEQCDPWTGECLGPDRRCKIGRGGPSCQKMYSSPLWQGADFASDDSPSTCGKITWLSFNQTITASVLDVIAKGKDKTSFEILRKPSNIVPIKETKGRTFGCGNKLQLVFVFDLSDIDYLKLSDDKICDVRLSVCSPGTFGSECFFQCHCSNNSPCNTVDGACPGSCEIGWEKKACDEKCSPGTFGENCTGRCHCSDDEPCDHVTGNCSNGCSDGWVGSKCNQPCPAGKFGKNCLYECGNCINNTACNHISGSCFSGCQKGWQVPRCKVEDSHAHDNHNHNTESHEGGSHHGKSDHDSTTVISTKADGNCTECEPVLKVDQKESSSSSKASLAYGILGASLAILVVLTIAAVVYTQRKRINRKDIVIEVETPSRRETRAPSQVQVVAAQVEEVIDVIDMEADVLDDEVLKIYDDDFVLDSDPNGPLPVAKLWSRILELRNDDDMLLREFASLPIGICDKVDDATLPDNKKKNRYNGVYPYDFNRVKLKRPNLDEKGSGAHLYDNLSSDFINASFFKGFGREKAYIVTQGPLEWTRGDFWELVWQEGTRQIVMLTNLIEDRKIKCSQYWPNEGEAHFGKVCIKYISSISLPNFSVTNLEIKMGKESEPRGVSHYHYETWPDKSVPENAWNLVDFWRHVRARRQDSDGPLVVHCSAGIGRSGTYIGLDYLYDQAVSRGSVKVFDCVRMMRKYRLNMVQTKLQYLYLHEIVAEALHCGSFPMDQQLFPDYFEELNQNNPQMEATNMQMQYENLCEGIAFCLSEEQDQIYANNRSVHIQALYLKSHEGVDKYLLEQSCYIGEDEEFWRNVYRTQSTTVITFESIDEELNCLEDGTMKKIGEIELMQHSKEIIQTDDKMRDLFIRRKLSIQLQDEMPHEVHLFETTLWNAEQCNFTAKDILRFIDYITEWQNEKFCKQIIVLQYGDDPSRLGPFLVIYDELDRLRKTNKIGVYEAVWRFKFIFPNMIPDFKQYSLCYTVLAERQKDSTTYYNM